MLFKADKESLYERLGGVFGIAAVVDHFSNALINDPIVGKRSKNEALAQWHSEQAGERLPGLKFMRTLWVCQVAGGPFRFRDSESGALSLNLKNAHRDLNITSAEFDRVAKVLGESLDACGVAQRESEEVLEAFAAHKDEVVSG